MVFIFTRLRDDTTVKVIQWLVHFGKTFFRFNSAADLPPLLSKVSPSAKEPDIIDSCYFNGGSMIIPPLGIDDPAVHLQVREFLREEANTLLADYLSGKTFCRVFGLSPFSGTKINKLEVLRSAEEAGIRIPETEIVTTKERLQELKATWGRIVTKGVNNGISISTDKVMISGQRTQEVTQPVIDRMGETFFPTLIQKLVEKKYELRVFYFRGIFYAIAIFSQGTEATNIDWRNNDPRRPNREVPYALPDALKQKLCRLMKVLGLNYGSIDLIVTAGSNYCFLEVNPYGQYGFLSTSGNFYIEKQIAAYL